MHTASTNQPQASSSAQHRLLRLIRGLNANCTTIGAGTLAEMQALAKTCELEHKLEAFQNAPAALSAHDQYAINLAAMCFGPGAPETLRLAQFAVERAGLLWLQEAAPSKSGESDAEPNNKQQSHIHRMFTAAAGRLRAFAFSSVQVEVGNGSAGPTSHFGLFRPQIAKDGIGAIAGTGQIHTAATVAAPTLRVVIRKAPQLAFALLRFKVRLLCLQAKVSVLALQRPDPLSQKGQVLTQHRSRCAFVDQRLHLIQQRLKHFILLRAVQPDGSDAECGGKGGAA